MKKNLQSGKHRVYISILFLLTITGSLPPARAQDQQKIDSIINVLAKTKDDTTKIILLSCLSFNYSTLNTNKGIKYGEEALELSKKMVWKKGIALASGNLGINYKAKSDYPKALEFELKALSINQEIEDQLGIATNMGNIGLLYANRGDTSKALEYYRKAMKIDEKIDNKNGLAINLVNASSIYDQKNDYPHALDYLMKALNIYKQTDNRKGVAAALSNIGTLYASQNKYSEALAYDFDALRMEEANGNKTGIALNEGNIGEVYYYISRTPDGRIRPDSLVSFSKTANLNKGIFFLKKSIESCKKIDYLRGMIKFSKSLSKAYLSMGDSRRAMEEYVAYTETKDSVFSTESNLRLRQIEMAHDKELKDKELSIEKLKNENFVLSIRNKREERNYLLAGIALLLLVIYFIIKERKKTEKLLLNILPQKIAVRLKKKEHPIADHFENVSIIFIDMAGFTKFAENRDPRETVSTLNEVFTHFDHLAEKHGLEKIKTIGDCYMAVAGLPDERRDHAAATVAMALEIKETMKGYLAKDGTPIHFRIGLDCGAVVAGVIGKKKFIYDLWGDAVNTASRMESTGEEGQIHCTDNFKKEVEAFPYEHAAAITFTNRGGIEVKSKGVMQTWFISLA